MDKHPYWDVIMSLSLIFLIAYLIVVVLPVVVIYRRSPRFRFFVKTCGKKARSLGQRMAASLAQKVAWCVLAVLFYPPGICLAIYQFVADKIVPFVQRHAYGAPPVFRSVKPPAPDAVYVDALREATLREDALRAELAAANQRISNHYQQRQYLSRAAFNAKFIRKPLDAVKLHVDRPLHTPAVKSVAAAREPVKKAARYASTSTQTMEVTATYVKATYVNAATQVKPEIRPAPKTTCAITLNTAVQTIEPGPTLQTSSAASFFSKITAVHTIEPVPYTRPAIQTTDAGVQVHSSDDLVSRDALRAQEERHASETAALNSQHDASFKAHHSKYLEALKDRDERHASEIAALKSSHEAQLNQLASSRNSDSSALSTAQSELTRVQSEQSDLLRKMNIAQNEYNTMNARVQSLVEENGALKGHLQAANVAMASSADPQAVQRKLQEMEGECLRLLGEKDKDCARRVKAAEARFQEVSAAFKKADADALVAPELRRQIAVLELQTNKGKLPGGVSPGDGSRKNAGALENELAVVKEQRDDCWRKWKESSEGWKLCDQHRLAAMVKVGELERDLARFRGSIGPGARTIVPAQTVNSVLGKRGAEEGMEGGKGKRTREDDSE